MVESVQSARSSVVESTYFGIALSLSANGLEVEDPALVRVVADVARSRGLDDAVE
jgi:hypothetical protein